MIASGGLRHGVHLAKAVALGAGLGAMALPFIRAVMAGGTDGVLALIARIDHELRVGHDIVRRADAGRAAPRAGDAVGRLPPPGGRTAPCRGGGRGHQYGRLPGTVAEVLR